MEVVYITRAYMTRHGAGPFPTEVKEKPYQRIIDLTNVPNPYQGTLRYGLLDLNELKETIENDLKNIENKFNYKLSLAITCLDQVDNKVKFLIDKKQIEESIDEFLCTLYRFIPTDNGYGSYGMTRETIKKY